MEEAMLKDLIESVLPGKDNATVNTGCRFCRLFLVQIIYIKYEVYDQYIFGIWSIVMIFLPICQIAFCESYSLVGDILDGVQYSQTAIVSGKKITV